MKNQDGGEYRPDDLFYLTPTGERELADLEARWPDGSGEQLIGLTPAGERAADCIASRNGARRVLHAIAGGRQ